MEEEEVNYASVVFNNPKTSPPKATREEDTIYSTIVVNTQGNEAGPASVTKDKKSTNGSNHLLLVVFCLGILCVILVSAITALCVYFTRAANEKDKDLISELKQLRHNQTALLAGNHNLTRLVNKFNSDIEDLSNDRDNLTNLIGNLSQDYDSLERKNIKLERQLERLDAYCPMENTGSRVCRPCLNGWDHHSSSCYAINDAQPDNRITWQKARDDCRAKHSESDLTVIDSPEEQKYIYDHSWRSSDETNGYWIGLTSESGRWRWVDGRNLTEGYWITQSGEGQCATSVQKTSPRGWYAVNCAAKNQWICEMKDFIV